MGGRAEQGQGGHQREDREDEEAHSVQHDGRELPVVDDERLLLAGLDCLGDHPQLLQYQGQLPGCGDDGGGGGRGTSLLPSPGIFQITLFVITRPAATCSSFISFLSSDEGLLKIMWKIKFIAGIKKNSFSIFKHAKFFTYKWKFRNF